MLIGVMSLFLAQALSGCPEPPGDQNGNGMETPCPTIYEVDAGPDVEAACLPVELQASVPGEGNQGEWSVIPGDGYELSAVQDPSAVFSGAAGETYVLTWTVSNECGSESDSVSVGFDAHPTEADAGDHQVVEGDNLTLAGNEPTIGAGEWSILSGEGGSLSDSKLPNALFTGQADETYELEWRISTSCYSSADTLTVSFVSPSPVPFTDLDLWVPLSLRVDPGVHLIRDTETWVELGHRWSPPGVDEGTVHLLVFPGEYVFPGTKVLVDSILESVDGTTWTIDVRVVRPAGCASYPLPAPAFALVEVELPADEPIFIVNQTLVDEPCEGSADNEWSCSTDAPCEEGQLCHGLTWADPGFCRELDASGIIPFEGGSIPADEPNGLVVPIEVKDLRSVPEDIQLQLTVDHPSLADLLITLTNPDETVGIVRPNMPGPAEPFTRNYVVTGIPGDESANGTWTLRIVDSGDGGGILVGGALGLTTRWD